MTDTISSLLKIIKNSGLESTIDPARISETYYYDPTYSIGIVATSISLLGKEYGKNPDPEGMIINRQLLNLSQFVATRPNLLPEIERWASLDGNQQPLDKFLTLPRGFYLDHQFRNTLDYLRTLGDLDFNEKNVIWPNCKNGLMADLLVAIKDKNLFLGEIEVLLQIKKLGLTLKQIGAQ